MRILVTGSRGWKNWIFIREALKGAWADWDYPASVTVIHGGARGADMMADIEAGCFGWRVKIYRPDWEQYGKRAGFIRNLEMVKAGADICLAFILDCSRGATHCADAAERAGIPVRRYRA